jgi:hypothetical protein
MAANKSTCHSARKGIGQARAIRAEVDETTWTKRDKAKGKFIELMKSEARERTDRPGRAVRWGRLRSGPGCDTELA